MFTYTVWTFWAYCLDKIKVKFHSLLMYLTFNKSSEIDGYVS